MEAWQTTGEAFAEASPVEARPRGGEAPQRRGPAEARPTLTQPDSSRDRRSAHPSAPRSKKKRSKKLDAIKAERRAAEFERKHEQQRIAEMERVLAKREEARRRRREEEEEVQEAANALQGLYKCKKARQRVAGIRCVPDAKAEAKAGRIEGLDTFYGASCCCSPAAEAGRISGCRGETPRTSPVAGEVLRTKSCRRSCSSAGTISGCRGGGGRTPPAAGGVADSLGRSHPSLAHPLLPSPSTLYPPLLQ
jgi:hypothetical protein